MIKTASISIFALALTAAAAVPVSMEEKSFDVDGFTAVGVAGKFDVTVTIGSGYSVMADGDSDDIAEMRATVKDGSLHIYYEDNDYRPDGTVKVAVTMPSISKGAMAGSGSLAIEGASGSFKGAVAGSGSLAVSGGKFDNMNLALSGSGKLVMDSDSVSDVDIALSGSGSVTAAGGNCDTVDVALAGSGDIDARDLRCKSGGVKVSGSGDVAMHASNSISGSTSGSGEVDVYGNPEKRNVRSSGSGGARYK